MEMTHYQNVQKLQNKARSVHGHNNERVVRTLPPVVLAPIIGCCLFLSDCQLNKL